MSETSVALEDFTSDSDLLNGAGGFTTVPGGLVHQVGSLATTRKEVEDETVQKAEEEPEETEQITGSANEQDSLIPRGANDNSGEERKLFVGGLSWETKEQQLQDYFEKFGEIESVNLKIDPITGRSRCFAFLVLKNASDVEKVLSGGEHAINSKKVDVKRAKAKPGKIFVGGLVEELESDQIKSYFLQFGNITELEMPFDKTKNQRKNFCFITFEREETMKELLKSPKQKIGEFEVDVKRATPKSGFRGGFGGGDFYSQMDYYYGYPDYYGWGGGAGGGKAPKGSRGGGTNSAPY